MEGRALFALNAVIEGLYASAADGTPWDAKQVRSLLGTDFCHLLCMDETGTIINASSSDLSEESQREYLTYWAHRDEFGPALFAQRTGYAFTDEALMARRVFESMPVFEGFYKPHGMVHFGVGYHAATNGLFVGISAQNTREAGRVSAETLQYINLLNQHLRRAFQINEDVTALLGRAQAGDHLLFQWGLGLLRCDACGHIDGMYGQADALLTRFRALVRVTGGRLRLLDVGGDRRLEITRAEADVLAKLMLGTSVTAIADSRGSTLETVRSYLKTLRKKLNCTSQVELVSLGWSTTSFQPGAILEPQ